MDDPFVTHGTEVGDDSEGEVLRFVSLGDGPKQQAVLEGIFLSKEESKKYPGQTVYTFGTKEEIVLLGGSKFLEDKLTDVGALYRIRFTGKARGATGREYKTFDILTVSSVVAKEKGLDRLYKSDSSVLDGIEDE